MQLHIESTTLVGELSYLSAASGGGTESVSLPLLRVPCSSLSPSLDGLLLTSDLQGVAPAPSRGGALRLLGEAFVDWYDTLAQADTVPSPDRVGVLLAGDLFSHPLARKRGATGDVGPVWDAFAHDFAWVAGVAGNHDLFTSRIARAVQRRSHVALLDGETVNYAGLTIGGVGGIVGKKGKTNRKPLPSFTEALHRATAGNVDILVLHDAPPGRHPDQWGRTELSTALHKRPPLLVSGHCHWAEPFSVLPDSTHVNVDGRAVLLVPA